MIVDGIALARRPSANYVDLTTLLAGRIQQLLRRHLLDRPADKTRLVVGRRECATCHVVVILAGQNMEASLSEPFGKPPCTTEEVNHRFRGIGDHHRPPTAAKGSGI